MRRLLRQLLRVAGAVLGAAVVLVFLELVVSALGGGSHRIADWAISQLDKVFRPVGHWFVNAPDWAWISVIMVLGFPAAYLMTWALDEAGIGIKPKHKPRWMVAIWIIVVGTVGVGIQWARRGF